MTRDEAVNVMSEIWGGNRQHALGESYVDAFVALGMLKLDEPKSAQQKLDALFSLYRLEDARLKMHEFLAYLDEAGLKIVEK